MAARPGVPYKDDYLFASQALGERLRRCLAFNPTKWYAFSDIARLSPKSLEEIAEKLNLENVPTIHGTNRWTAASVRKAFVS